MAILSDRVIFEKPDFHQLMLEGKQVVDMHCHTMYSHDCQSKPHLIRDRLRRYGFGLAVTDHNEYRGSLAFSRFDDIFLIPGIEVTGSNDKDILFYFNNFKDLESFGKKYVDGKRKYKSSVIVNKLTVPFLDLIDGAKEHNGLVSLPHPFMRSKGSYYWLQKKLRQIALKNVDAIEVLNGSQRLKRNVKSANWSAHANKAWTGGSDSHIIRTIGDVVTTAHADSAEEFLEAIRKRQNQVIGNKTKYHEELLTALTILKNKL